MWQDSMKRLMEATECQTQFELATFLDVHPSSVANGKKRGTVPAAWLITALKKKGVNPDWIITGSGPRYLIPAQEEFPDAAWQYSLQIVLTNPSKVLSRIHMRELLAEAYRRCLFPVETNGENPD